MSETAARLPFATALAAEAAALAERLRAEGGTTIAMKGAQDFVTEADGAVERFLRARIEAAFPGEAILGEEMGGAPPAAGALWILDPIDGTSNYARGGDRWCVSVGLVRDGRPVLGVIARHRPAEVFAAAEGAGATRNGAPARAAATGEIGRAIVEVGWSFRRPPAQFHALCQAVMARGAGVRSTGSGSLGLAEAATGRLDAYLEAHINSWDAAAAIAIAQEAGAWTNGFASGDWIAAGNPIGVGAPALAAELTAMLAVVPGLGAAD